MKPYIGSMIPPTTMAPEASKQAGEIFKNMGVKKCCAIYDMGIKNAGIVDPIIDCIKAQGIEVVVYDKVQADPPDYSVIECGQLLIDEQCDGVVAIGGGSSMDTAKAATMFTVMDPQIVKEKGIAVYQMGGPEILDGSKLKIKLITIPTTAGTGSEGTKGGMVTDTKDDNNKICIGDDAFLAKQVLIDPLLQLGLPPHPTAACGMDAMAHSVEAIIGNCSEWKCNILFDGIKSIWNWLPVAVKDGKNVEARSRMCYAANVAMGFSEGFSGHAFAHTLGALYHVPHGDACAYALPPAIRYQAPSAEENVRELAKVLGLDSTAADIGDVVATAMENFYQSLGLKPLCEWKDIDDLDTFISKMRPHLKTKDIIYTYGFTPPMSDDDCAEYLKQMYYGKK